MKKILILIFCVGVSSASLAQNVVQGEYFIDTDLGFGNNTQFTLTPSANNSFPFTVNFSSYTPGYHKLYIRTKDSNGNWSFTSRTNVEVLASQAKTTIIGGEYFIDKDSGFGKASPFSISSPDSIVLQNFSAVASTLSEGYHKLYGRVKDNLGRWSLTFRRNMEVYKSTNTKVVHAEYFFKTDLGFGNCTPVTLSNPASDGSFTFNIPRNTIPSNADTLFIRVQNDIEYKWSLTQMLNGIAGALPLTLINFRVMQENAAVALTWQTTNEVNTAYFSVERSLDVIHFNTIGKVDAANIRSAINNYNYADNIEGISAPVIYYRLKQVDKDGNFRYSKIVSLKIDVWKPGIKIFPNPASDYLNINTDNPEDLNGAVIKLADMTGRITMKQNLNAEMNQQVNIGALANGIYILYINKHSGMVTQKLIKE